MKLGTAEIFRDELATGSFGNSLRGVCQYLNKKRADINPEWIVQIVPGSDAYGSISHWIVVYRWPTDGLK